MSLPPDHAPVILRALWLLEGRIVNIPAPKHEPREPKSGWSRPPTVIPCPSCGNRAYSYQQRGFPWRRCDGPAGCGHEWNPEEEVAGC